MQRVEQYAVLLIFAFSFAVQLEAVTVNPLAPICPTNKVAPRRKRFDKINSRTFGQFYHLLTPESSSSLQEKPLSDAPDDCGEIEDYDENDISSVTSKATRRQGHKHNHLQGGTQHLLNQHHYYGVKPPTVPPNRPTRPPPAGYFGNNNYTPPKPQEPTDYVKPVHEPGYDVQMPYYPGIVGAPSGHVIGLPQKHVAKPFSDITIHNRKPKYSNHAYAHGPTTTQSNLNTNKHHRLRKFSGDSGILGSFVDLFF